MNTIETIRAALRLSYDWNRSLAEDMRDAPLTFPTPHGDQRVLRSHLVGEDGQWTQFMEARCQRRSTK